MPEAIASERANQYQFLRQWNMRSLMGMTLLFLSALLFAICQLVLWFLIEASDECYDGEGK
jgi:hypothetical protein